MSFFRCLFILLSFHAALMAAAFNVSLDDSSPLISYSPLGAWIDTPNGQGQGYFDKSLHTTTHQGATASFNFSGTGFWIYGGLSPDYGRYTVTLDGSPVANLSAFASTLTPQKLLYGTGGLSFREYSIVLTCTGTKPIDIDSVIIQSQLDPNFTQVDNAQMSFSFAGEAIAVYGGSSFDHGNYTVSLDGQTYQFNGGSNNHSALYHPTTMMFFANAKFFDLDSIVVYSGGNNSTDAGNSSSSTAPSSNLSNGAFIGIVIGVVGLILLLLGLGVFLCIRRRRRRQRVKAEEEAAAAARRVQDSESPVLPIQDPDLEKAKEAVSYPRNQAGFHPSSAYPFDRDGAKLNRNITTNTRWSQSSYTTDASISSTDEIVLPGTPAPLQHHRQRSVDSDMGSDIDDITRLYRQTVHGSVGPAPLRQSPPGRNTVYEAEFDHVPL
ncbi:hypothetical protein C8Q75DRAFT_547759 [Abortiporus biennis]|nr:hypothetical protein C8Q75DRAFT_547759 [Abortiporus biennis]